MLPTDANIEKPMCALVAQIEHAGAEGTALRYERDVALLGRDGQERRVEPYRGTDHSEAVGADDPHRRVLEDPADLLLERRPSLAGLPEARRHHDGAADVDARAGFDHFRDALRRHSHHGEVDVRRDLRDGRVALEAEDLAVLGVDGEDLASPRRHQVVHDRAADGALGLTRADQRDGLWIEHLAHIRHLGPGSLIRF
jgi:hypothetical protein